MATAPPPSFLLIVQLHHLQAMLHLGAIVNPMTGKHNPVDLDRARHELTLLEILNQKTAGNLTDEEETLLAQVIDSVREVIESRQAS
jgi:hypothetical protein